MSKAELVKEMVDSVRGKSERNIVINVHTHLWNFDCIPEAFQARYEGIPHSFDITIPLLEILKKFYKEEGSVDKLRNFLEICKAKTIKDVVDVLLSDSDNLDPDEKIIFTPLMMDMKFATRDTENQPKISFDRQMRMTKDIVLDHPGYFLPFIAADPRRISAYKALGATNGPDGIGYITKALEKNGFWGVKIYPTLGYKPADPYLLPLYDYCEKNGIPITAHCNYGGLYSAQDKKKKDEYKEMANPENWEPVLERCPNLKLNLAHFGGDLVSEEGTKEKKWHETIIEHFGKYPNVYSDIAYHEAMFKHSDKYFDQLKEYSKNDIIWKKILYGTDWWVNRMLCKEWVYLDIFRGLSEEHKIRNDDISCILNSNAVEFLGLNNNNPTSGPLFNYISFLVNNKRTLPTWFKFS